MRQNRWERYEQIVRLHINPALRGVKLKSLTPTHVRALYRDKLDAGLARRTVQYIHTTLHKALKQAMNDRLVPRSVTEAVKAPGPSSKEVKPLSAGQARALLKAARGDRFEAIYVLTITAGLREGELLGLKWEDVDLGTEKLSVRRGLTITKYGPALGAPKRNKSRRSIRLTAPAAEALKRHKLTQKAERLRLGSLWEDNYLIFPNQTGGLMRPWSLTGGSYLRLLRRAGLPETTRFHDLRHTCVTLLLSKGVHPKIVQELLGHASISITLDTYSHVLPNMQEKAVDAMESALF